MQNLDENFLNKFSKVPLNSPNVYQDKYDFKKENNSINQNKVDFNNVFLNNYEINSKNNNNNDISINKNLLDISEIFSSNYENNKIKGVNANDRLCNKKNNQNNINDDLTLILSPKGVEGITSYSNVLNIEFKSNFFIDQNNQKSHPPDNSKINFYGNNHPNNYLIEANKQQNNKYKNTLDNSFDNHFGIKDNIINNIYTNTVNSQNTNRLNNINVQKFLNKGENSFKMNKLNDIKFENSTFDKNMNLYNNLYQDSAGNEVKKSKYYNNPVNTNENLKDVIENNNLNHIHKRIDTNIFINKNKNWKNTDFEDKANQPLNNNNIQFKNKHINNHDVKQSVKDHHLPFNENITKYSNLNEFNITSEKKRNFTDNPNSHMEVDIRISNLDINSNLNLRRNIKNKNKSTSSNSKLNNIKYTNIYNFGNIENILGENKNYNVHSSEKSNEMPFNLLKQARLERQHKKSESLNAYEFDNNINKEKKIKQIDSTSIFNDHQDNSSGNFNSLKDSNKNDKKGFNKNTVDFFNDYKKQKNSPGNLKVPNLNSLNNNYISLQNTDNYNYNDKETNEMMSDLGINFINSFNNNIRNNEFIRISENNYNHQQDKFPNNFTSNNYDNQKNFSSHVIKNNNNNEINCTNLKKYSEKPIKFMKQN